MKGKNAAKQLSVKVFLCSVIRKIGRGGGFKNKNEKIYLEKEAEKEILTHKRICQILEKSKMWLSTPEK